MAHSLLAVLLRRILLAACLVALSLLFFPVLAVTNEELQNRIEAKNRELRELSSQISEVQGKLDGLESQGKSLAKELSSIDYTVRQLTLGIRSSEVLIQKLELEMEELGDTLVATEGSIEDKRGTMVSILQRMQERDARGTLEIVLRAETLADSVLEIQNLSTLQSELIVQVEGLRSLTNDLSSTLDARSAKKAQIERENKNLRNRKGITEEQGAYRKTLLAETKNQESAYQKQLTVLEAKQEEIAGEINNLEESLRLAFDASLLPVARLGVLKRPVAAQFPLTQGYGRTAFALRAYKTQFHNGVDWGVPIGTPVTASLAGRVVRAGDNGRYQYGKYILIEHPNNLVTLYAHLSRHAVRAGDTVQAGELIGYSGKTGYSTGPHLHLTVYSEPAACRASRTLEGCVQLKSFAGAGLVPVGATVDPHDYLE